MKNKNSFLVFVFIILLSNKIISQKPFGDSLWTMVFNDEFTGTTVDNTKWLSNWPTNQNSSYVYYNYLTHTYDTISHKNIKAYETENFANVNVNAGTATIISKKENYYGKCWDRWPMGYCWGNPNMQQCPIDTFVWFKYTTGLLISQAKFKYGYFETRIKLPDHVTNNDIKGLGPAFFLYNQNGTAVNNWSEIDVFEFAGKYDGDGMYNKLTSNVHYRHCSPASFTITGCNTTYDTSHWTGFKNYPTSIAFNNQFHKIGMHWTPDKIDFYLDDVQYHHIDSTSNTFNTSPSKMMEMPMIMGISHPSTNFSTHTDTINTKFPYNFEIDYVKVWQYKQYCDSTLNICNFNSSSYDPAIYKEVKVGSPSAGTGCGPTISSGQNVSFIGKNYVLLDEGFNVQSGGQFLGDVKPCINFFENARMAQPSQYPLPPPAIFYERITLKQPH